ncbi:MAG: purine-nucleoside phosphorylase [Actinomycetota bacterium]|nr:purine-nucleoside phosphorylase [Actinomycetota bacterium]
MTETIHLRPSAPVAERVLLPGDPGRALRLAQLLVETPAQMLNHHRGLWGYTGVARDGALLTIQSTGMGGPSAAIVVEELIALGAQQLLRVGTCGALVPDLSLGDLLIAERVMPADGVSRLLGADPFLLPDAHLLAKLESAATESPARRATIVSADLFYDPDPSRPSGWMEQGAVAVEMEAAAILAVAARHGIAAGCALVVSDELAGATRRRISTEALHAAEERLGRLAASALGA